MVNEKFNYTNINLDLTKNIRN